MLSHPQAAEDHRGWTVSGPGWPRAKASGVASARNDIPAGSATGPKEPDGKIAAAAAPDTTSHLEMGIQIYP